MHEAHHLIAGMMTRCAFSGVLYHSENNKIGPQAGEAWQNWKAECPEVKVSGSQVDIPSMFSLIRRY